MNQCDVNEMLKPKLVRKSGIPRPTDLIENPYIGKDGRDYSSFEALEQANREYNERMFQKKPVKRLD